MRIVNVDKTLNVLVVDDSAVMRAVVKRAIKASGVAIANIHEAPDGAQAIGVLEANSIDVVFTDINMPVMTGIELLQAIMDRGWDHLTRIVVSTEGSTARRDELGRLGVRATVEKPFVPEAIRDALRDAG